MIHLTSLAYKNMKFKAAYGYCQEVDPGLRRHPINISNELK
jgi:hypothetical protein